MLVHYIIFAKLGLGLLVIIFQINIMGKGNLAPASALDQVQNYVYRRPLYSVKGRLQQFILRLSLVGTD